MGQLNKLALHTLGGQTNRLTVVHKY